MKIIMFIVAITVMSMFVSCTSDIVQPGELAVVKSSDGSSEVVSSGRYREWPRDQTFFIDTKIQSNTEKLNVLCQDEINMGVDIKIIGNLAISPDNSDQLDMLFKKVNTTSGNRIEYASLYKIAVRDIVRAISRDIISQYKTDTIRPERAKIQAAIKKRVIEKVKQFPVTIIDILISNLDYPATVTKQRERIKQIELKEIERDAAAKAELAEAKRKVEVETEKAKVSVVKAKATAAVNRIIASSLSSAYLKYLSIQVMQDVSTNANKDRVFIPTDANIMMGAK